MELVLKQPPGRLCPGLPHPLPRRSDSGLAPADSPHYTAPGPAFLTFWLFSFPLWDKKWILHSKNIRGALAIPQVTNRSEVRRLTRGMLGTPTTLVRNPQTFVIGPGQGWGQASRRESVPQMVKSLL